MVYSDIGEIVLDGLMVVQQPEDYIGKVGDTVTFSVAARGDGLSYQWQSSTNGGSSWHNSTASGYATATARVTMTEGNPGYLYRCKITDSEGNVIYSEPGKIILLSETWRYTYNADGLRTSRTDGETTYSYIYNGSSLTRMTVGSDTLTFGYDASGKPLFVQWNNSRYFYATNLQGDVVAIVSVNGIPVVEYTYDAWGNILSITGARADNLGKLNPLRYRGYVYDTETGLYYLQSRYYDPSIGRFLNADAFASTGQGLLGNNMFAYCGNNPICRCDPSGSRHIWFQLFEDHNYGFLHATVQAHILATRATATFLLDKELYVPGGRIDIVALESKEIWEIKHAGSDIYTRAARIMEALDQIKRYIQADNKYVVGKAGTFYGTFTVNYGNTTYLIAYETPIDGVILYSVGTLSELDPEPYRVYVPKPVLVQQQVGTYLSVGLCGAVLGACSVAFKQLASD